MPLPSLVVVPVSVRANRPKRVFRMFPHNEQLCATRRGTADCLHSRVCVQVPRLLIRA
jgi:hypothetical protein